MMHSQNHIKNENNYLSFLYKQFKNTTNKQPPSKTLFPHTIMADPLGKKFVF